MKQLHFVGIGGIGMSGIAKFFIHLGYQVSGSDIRQNHQTESLKQMGATVFIGHDARNLSHLNTDAILISSTGNY